MTKQEFSKHILQDRLERMVTIATTIGYGNIIKVFVTQGKYGKVRQCLTDTGVIIIKEYDSEKILTMYAIRLNRAIALYRSECSTERLPQRIINVILNNEKKRPYLFDIDE